MIIVNLTVLSRFQQNARGNLWLVNPCKLFRLDQTFIQTFKHLSFSFPQSNQLIAKKSHKKFQVGVWMWDHLYCDHLSGGDFICEEKEKNEKEKE